MELYFYCRSSKPFGKGVYCNYARIVLDEERSRILEETALSIGYATIFQSRHLENNYCNSKSGREISEICKRHNMLRAILETDVYFIKQLINNMDGVADWGILHISDREKLHYAVIGEDKCALVIAYDK